VSARYHPAGDGGDVSGNFFDAFATRRGVWGVVIGDVCGKGAAAAAMTAYVR
jgi:serine phosphatase RsbU (regulator of sigma subunit)